MLSNEKDEGVEVKLPVSLRDWFAGQAMAGLCASSTLKVPKDGNSAEIHYASLAYRFADVMLAERAKRA